MLKRARKVSGEATSIENDGGLMSTLKLITTNDENIGNHGYIGTSILQIYRRIFWKKISIGLKLLKTHENVRKTS